MQATQAFQAWKELGSSRMLKEGRCVDREEA